jgi:Kef-type K+ transport system membrane component KefB
MTPTRLAAFYGLTLVCAGVIIWCVFRLGAVLPPPEAAAAVTAKLPAVAAQAPAADLLAGFRANLESPLARLFVQLVVILAVARLVGGAFTRIGLPSVVGEMVAGVLLGPSLFGWLTPGAFAFVFPADSLGALRLLSQVGVCLFMFAVGMDLDVARLKDKAPSAVAVSHASIVAPFLMGVTLAWFLFTGLAGPKANFTSFALFLGISMSITAFPVLARILQERGMTQTPLGAMAITCAAVGDATAWSILAFVMAVSGAGTLSGAVVTLALVLAFGALMIWLVRPLLPRWLGAAVQAPDELPGGALAVVLLVVITAALATEVIGVHALFGAFLAGAVMPTAQNFRARVKARVEKFSTVLLLPLFFVFTGLKTRIDLLGDPQSWLICLLIILVATTGKLGAGAAAARLTGMGWRESLQVGALMNTRGLMELIVLNIGYDLGILSPRIFAMLVVMALVTTLMTGPLLTFFMTKAARGAERTASPVD